jgi:hypothetical protein
MRASDYQDEQGDFVALVAPVADDDARLPSASTASVAATVADVAVDV